MAMEEFVTLLYGLRIQGNCLRAFNIPTPLRGGGALGGWIGDGLQPRSREEASNGIYWRDYLKHADEEKDRCCFLEYEANLENQPTKHPYDIQVKTREMERRLEKLERMQIQIQEQLTEFQQEMRDQMLELRRTMINQFNRLLAESQKK
ncbi:uncharacterized protein LOC128035315 [Gossypium raimondii]|uniref:uncharacterized protein LOC128035315 n=1 Tax=Gossypium raimondii TaxID=29730 RepID=UPI00227D3AD8|nr:uncharacterized protein LOC128035315 [Gossypium raimondii]